MTNPTELSALRYPHGQTEWTEPILQNSECWVREVLMIAPRKSKVQKLSRLLLTKIGREKNSYHRYTKNEKQLQKDKFAIYDHKIIGSCHHD